MNKLKTITRIKIFVGILVSYGLVVFISPQIFLANSPRLQPEFIARFRATPQAIYALARYPFNTQERNNIIESAQVSSNEEKSDLPFQPIAPGVYAAEDAESNEKYIKIEKGTKVEIREVILTDGRKVKVYVPIQ